MKELDEIFREQGVTPKIYVAVGGEGTVRKVMERILGTVNMLGIIPTGSGNGLARELGIDCKPERLIKTIEQGETIPIDVLKINGHLGLNVSGIGFDAEVAYRFARLGIRGLAGYLLSSLQALWCFNLFYAHMSCGYTTTRLHIDGDPIDETDETLDISLLPGAIRIVVPIKPKKSE